MTDVDIQARINTIVFTKYCVFTIIGVSVQPARIPPKGLQNLMVCGVRGTQSADDCSR